MWPSAEATLLFRGACRRCRFLARLSVLAACGMLRAVPLDSAAAQRLYERHPQTRGKLALIEGDRYFCGPAVVPAGLLVAARGLARRLGGLIAVRQTGSRRIG